tara:strand:- start:2208 stop:3698 length:1491 start_codon:yes stop_codon:yes gene_type:complete
MSYRNPKIIDDKSGQVLGQAIAKGAQTIAQGIIGMEKQNQLAREKREKEAKEAKLRADREADLTVRAIQDNAKNATAQFQRQQKYMKNVGSNFTDEMTKIVDEGGRLRIANITDKSPEMIARIKENSEKQANLNKFMVNVGGILPEAAELAGLTESQLKDMAYYTSINGDSGESAQVILRGLMATEGYGYDIEQEDGVNYLLINTPDGKSARFSEAELQAAGDLFDTRDQTTSQYLDKTLKDKVLVQTEGGGVELAAGLSQGPAVLTSEINDKGYKIIRQDVNANEMDALLNTEMLQANSVITTAKSKTRRNLYLKDLLIDPDTYDAAPPEERTRMVGDQITENILQKYGIKQVSVKAENDATIKEYYRESRGPAALSTDRKSDGLYNRYSRDLTKAMKAGKDKEAALADVFNIAGNKRIRIGGGYYTPKDISIEGDIVTVTKTGKPKQETKGGEDLDIVTFDLSNPKVLYNFLQSTTSLNDAQINKIRKQILAYK